MTELRVAVLDDYLNIARDSADWSLVEAEAELTYFPNHLGAGPEVIEALREFDIVVAMRERTAFPAVVLRALPRLKLLVTTGMRNQSIDLAAAEAAGIVVSGTGARPWSTSELTWALIFNLVRPTQRDDDGIRAGGWQTQIGGDLAGRTLGVLGLGRQGGRVAAVARALGMSVVAWSPHLTPERAAEQDARWVSKADLFSQADFVTLHMVLAESTTGIVGEAELRALGPDSFLINTARALLVDQDALRRGLEQSWIAGAALDVFDVEPLPANHWLRSSPRTLLSPHMGYVSRDGYCTFYSEAAEDITAYLQNRPVRILTS